MRAVALIGRYLFCCEMLCRYVCTALYVCTVPVSYCALLLLLFIIIILGSYFFWIIPSFVGFFSFYKEKIQHVPPPPIPFFSSRFE